MARPLNGGLRFQRGRWWASVPDKAATSGRHYESFFAEDDARAWLAQAVPAVRTGRPLPDAERFRTTKPAKRTAPSAKPPSAKMQSDVASVAKAWMAAAYEDLRRGGPDRAERVRRIVDGYLVPWFAPRTTTVSDITYYMAHDWLLHLVGREHVPTTRSASAGLAPLPASVDPETDELGLAAVARLCGVSLPTVRRRWRQGELPGAYRDPAGHIRVPVAALDGVRDKRRRAPAGLSQRYVSDALWVLRRVLGFARANGLFPPGFDPTESLDAPTPDPAAARTRRPSRQPRPLTLPECARIAAHLHPVGFPRFCCRLGYAASAGSLYESLYSCGVI